MNTIYDGTFVLGNTSATTYQAGNGISITQPSEGTVRISNDETVLYENNSSTANAGDDINLSESYKNFEYIRFEVLPIMGNDTMFSIFTTRVNPTSTGLLMAGGSLSYYDSNGFKLFCSTFQSKSDTKVYCRYNVSYQGSWTPTERISTLFVKRVIGINRISGGNA